MLSSIFRTRTVRSNNLLLCQQRRRLFGQSDKNNSSRNDNDIERCAEVLLKIKPKSREDAIKIAKQLSPETRLEISKSKVIVDNTAAATATKASITNAMKSTKIPEPSRSDLYLVALNQGIPFIGFGIMDNAILIIAGEAIDENLGVILGISTMCAAAVGNIISDVAGVMLGTVIEDFCAKLGLPTPKNLTQAQRSLRSVRFSSQLGCAIGLTIGCIIGMFPLLFIDAGGHHESRNKNSDRTDVQREGKNMNI